MNTKQLPKQFTGSGEVKGMEFTQKGATHNAYLYAVGNKNQYTHYEVFERKTVAVCIDFATREYSTTDDKEIYPKGKDFGSWAWSFRDLESAVAKLGELR